MSRYSMIHIPGGLYSVVSKCNNNEFLFDADKKFELYVRHLVHCKKKLGFLMHDIVCMSNHTHELYRLPENGVTIADILQTVKGHFSQKFNAAFNRSGHFWKNKPWYRIIENEEYALSTCRYFHWNPVRAGLVTNPEDWPYSGYRFQEFGERNGLFGQLLDPLAESEVPSASTERDKAIDKYVARLMGNKRARFVGGNRYRRKMVSKYGKLRTPQVSDT